MQNMQNLFTFTAEENNLYDQLINIMQTHRDTETDKEKDKWDETAKKQTEIDRGEEEKGV